MVKYLKFFGIFSLFFGFLGLNLSPHAFADWRKTMSNAEVSLEKAKNLQSGILPTETQIKKSLDLFNAVYKALRALQVGRELPILDFDTQTKVQTRIVDAMLYSTQNVFELYKITGNAAYLTITLERMDLLGSMFSNNGFSTDQLEMYRGLFQKTVLVDSERLLKDGAFLPCALKIQNALLLQDYSGEHLVSNLYQLKMGFVFVRNLYESSFAVLAQSEDYLKLREIALTETQVLIDLIEASDLNRYNGIEVILELESYLKEKRPQFLVGDLNSNSNKLYLNLHERLISIVATYG